MFEAMARYIPSPSNNDSSLPSLPQPPSPMQWGIPKVIQKRLGSNDKVKNIHFER